MPSLAGARELAGLLGLGRNLVQGAGLFIGPELFQQGRSGSMLDKSVQNLPGIILDPRTDIGKGAGAALSNELGYIGSQLQRGSLPYLGNEMRYVTNELGAGRIPYTDASKAKPKPKTVKPKVDASFDRRSPADLAYEAEKSRVAQLTAQDPELKRYADARKLAVAPGATPEQVQSAEDIGMQIWAAKHGNLAKQVKPGQSGYEAIQRTLYPGGTPASALPAESEAMLNAIAPTNEFGVRPNVTPMPGQLPSFGSNTEAMFNAITGGGSLVTPMPQQFVATTPQDQAQGLAETYKKALLGDLGNDPLGIAGIYRYGR